jgi:hypothetical protein
VVAAGTVRPGIQSLFEGLVPAEVIKAYDRLLAQDGCAKDQAEAMVGDAGLVEALTRCGMAHVQPHTPADPAWLRPASPDLALQGVLAGHQNQLARDQELLLDGHRRLADAQAQFGAGVNGRFPEHLVAVVSDRAEISELSASLVNTARKDWMTLENLHTEMPLTEDFAQPPLPVFGGQVRCRSIYDVSAMRDPVARRIIRACAEAGEQARLLPEVPMKTKLADRTTAMLPLTPTGTAGALVVRAPVIIAAPRGVLRDALGAGGPAQAAASCGSCGPANTGPAGGPGVDGSGPHRCQDRPADGDEYHHSPQARHCHHEPARRLKPIRGRGRGSANGMDRVVLVEERELTSASIHRDAPAEASAVVPPGHHFRVRPPHI